MKGNESHRYGQSHEEVPSQRESPDISIDRLKSESEAFGGFGGEDWEAIEKMTAGPAGMAVAHAALAISRVCQASKHGPNSTESYEVLCSHAAFHYQAAIEFIDWNSTSTESLTTILACAPYLVVFLQLVENDQKKVTELIQFSQMTSQELDWRKPGSNIGYLLHELSRQDVYAYMVTTVKSYYIQMEEISNIIKDAQDSRVI